MVFLRVRASVAGYVGRRFFSFSSRTQGSVSFSSCGQGSGLLVFPFPHYFLVHPYCSGTMYYVYVWLIGFPSPVFPLFGCLYLFLFQPGSVSSTTSATSMLSKRAAGASGGALCSASRKIVKVSCHWLSLVYLIFSF